MKTKATFAAWCTVLVLSGCGDREPAQYAKTAPSGATPAVRSAALPAPTPPPLPEPEGSAAQPTTARAMVYRHHIALELAAEDITAALQTSEGRCKQPACDIVSSTLVRPTADAPPTAHLEVRLAPGTLQDFKTAALALGKVLEDQTSAEDKTDQIIDVQARIANQTELRDRLRTLIKAPEARIKDLVEIHRQLAEVQAGLDSLDARRKLLAQETDKVFLALDFRPQPQLLGEHGSPVHNALKELGRAFEESIATLLTFVAVVLPWIIAAALAGVPLRAGWRRWRRRRT